MKPYFQNHSAGWLFRIVVICFFGMEIIQFFRQREWRKDATRIATPSFWAGVVVWVIVATVIVHRAGHYVPGAAMGHGGLVFAVGMVLLIAGAGLRWWSFWALGQYFTFTVDVSADQQVVTAGPYRMLRHPGYAGGLLAMIGIGVIYSNWVGLAGFTLSCLAMASGAFTSRRPHCSAPRATLTAATPLTTSDSYPSSGESVFRDGTHAPAVASPLARSPRLGQTPELVLEFDEWLGVAGAAGSPDNTGSMRGRAGGARRAQRRQNQR